MHANAMTAMSAKAAPEAAAVAAGNFSTNLMRTFRKVRRVELQLEGSEGACDAQPMVAL